MTDPISRWVNDEPGISAWTPNRFYRYALEQGVSDPKIIANAAALLHLTEEFIRKHPSVPFDRVVEAVIAGMDPELTLTYYQPGIRRLVRIKWRHWWRAFRRSPLKTISALLLRR